MIGNWVGFIFSYTAYVISNVKNHSAKIFCVFNSIYVRLYILHDQQIMIYLRVEMRGNMVYIHKLAELKIKLKAVWF